MECYFSYNQDLEMREYFTAQLTDAGEWLKNTAVKGRSAPELKYFLLSLRPGYKSSVFMQSAASLEILLHCNLAFKPQQASQ